MNLGRSNIKTVVVLVILFLVGILGVLGMNTVRTYMSGASAGNEPNGVVATPSSRSATISWSSDKETMGVVEYGTTPASLLLRAPETGSSTRHSVSIEPLKANVSYYFRIRIGEDVFDNNGIPWSFKTKSENEELEKTGVTLVPTSNMMMEVTPKSSPSVVNCDTNGDGMVTSVEKLKCAQTKNNCDTNGDGVVTSVEKLKCGQN